MSSHREIVKRMPLAMSKRPRDERGYPVPWFTPWHDGRWDFRFVEEGKAQQAVYESRCWICGEPRGPRCAYVAGTMCAVNRTSTEPPSHVECAIYAAKACPFLARPKMARPMNHEGVGEAMPGVMLDRNPGVAVVWITSSPSYDPAARLFGLGEPERVLWFAHSRPATRVEVMESIDSGLPSLRALAEQGGPDDLAGLEQMTADAVRLVPV